MGKLSVIMTQHTPLYSRLCFIIGLSRDASFIQNYKKEFRGPESGAVWRDRGESLKRTAQSEAELVRNLAKLN